MSEPFYILGFGQSNALGHADVGLRADLQDMTLSVPEVTFWNSETLSWEPARIEFGLPYATGLSRGGSMIWHAALEIHERTGRDVRLIIEANIGLPIDGVGAEDSGWIGNGTDSSYYQSLTEQVIAANVTNIDLVIFAQGEANWDKISEEVSLINSEMEYRSAIDTLLNQLRSESWFSHDTPFLMPELVPSGRLADRNDVILALGNDGDPATDTAFATQSYELIPDIGSSQIHWSVPGLQLMGLRITEAWERMIIDLPYDPVEAMGLTRMTAIPEVAQFRFGVDYSESDAGVDIDLLSGIGVAGFAKGDDLNGVLHVKGSRWDDLIIGNSGFNRIDGRAGNDEVNGASGRDWLIGGIGFDTLNGGGGNDILQGFDGYDVIHGGYGNDILRGGNGFDTLIAGEGNDILEGGLSPDLLLGGDDNDTLFGNSGFDILSGGDGDDTLYGNNGGDRLSGGAGHDRLDGGFGADALIGGDGNDTIIGENGFDALNGGRGDDILIGNSGSDTLDGGAGNDILQGGSGGDRFVFSGGQDIVIDMENDVDILAVSTTLMQLGETAADLANYVEMTNDNIPMLYFDEGNQITFRNLEDLDSLLASAILI